jgi:hypothetical protein
MLIDLCCKAISQPHVVLPRACWRSGDFPDTVRHYYPRSEAKWEDRGSRSFAAGNPSIQPA